MRDRFKFINYTFKNRRIVHGCHISFSIIFTFVDVWPPEVVSYVFG